MVFQLSGEGAKELHTRLEAAVAVPQTAIPGVVVGVVNNAGQLLFHEAFGQRGVTSPEKMQTDTVFWLASCSKLILSIACMQLVEKGLLSLDDSEQVEKICPALKDKRILRRNSKGQPYLEKKKTGITARMLLNHTGNHACFHLSTA